MVELEPDRPGIQLVTFQPFAAATGGVLVAGRGMPDPQDRPMAWRRLPVQPSVCVSLRTQPDDRPRVDTVGVRNLFPGSSPTYPPDLAILSLIPLDRRRRR